LLAILVSIPVGVSLATLGRKRGMDLSPLLALFPYVFWPSLSPMLALSTAFVAGVATILNNCSGDPCDRPLAYPLLGDTLLFVASLALYVHTLAPTILPADSGEFQFVAYVLGIAHPPGYPLYTMLAKLCTYLPFGDIAHRVNLFSAFTSALTLVVLSRAVKRATGSSTAGWIAAAVLGVSPTFWAQSTTANIRSLTALFTALQLAALVAYTRSKNPRYLLGLAIALGLGITHHGSTALLILPSALK